MKVWLCDLCRAEAADDEDVCRQGWMALCKVEWNEGRESIFGDHAGRIHREPVGYFCSLDCILRYLEMRAIEAEAK